MLLLAQSLLHSLPALDFLRFEVLFAEDMVPGKRTVVVTGASGLLGRAVLKRFEEAGWKSIGLAFSRAHKHPNLVKLDITDHAAVKQFFDSTKVSSKPSSMLDLSSTHATLQCKLPELI